MFVSEWRVGLDDAQLTAAHHGDSPLVIVAGAGTGKTRTLTSRVAALIERGVAPQRILLLTFTRRAAADMIARAATMCGDRSAARLVNGGTFHAIAHRLVAEHAEQLGLAAVSVLDQSDVVDLIDLMREEHGLTGSRARFPTAQVIADVYSKAVNTGTPIRDVIAAHFPVCGPHVDRIIDLLRAFVIRKRSGGLLDFDDLLLAWKQLLTDDVIAATLRSRWDHVLVDEYQDVNQIQVDIVAALRPGGLGLTVVGDDAQAVYGFRGARSSHLLDVAHTWPAATTVRLERNFRSLQPLLDLANVVRPGDGEHRLVLHADRCGVGVRPRLLRCYDSAAEAVAVADSILAAHEDGVPLREQAVLARTTSHCRDVEAELTVRRIPYIKYGGLRFVETAHVKDFIAALRLATNPRDEVAWFRLLGLHRDIGKARARTLLPLLLDADAMDLDAVVAAAPERSRPALKGTLANIAAARSEPRIVDQVDTCIGLLQPLVRAHYSDHALRLDDLDRLAAAARSDRDLPGFVAGLTLDPASKTTDYAQPPHVDDDFVTVSTVHSAKGLEWSHVHVIHALDGAFPSDMALHEDDGLEEEQRLFYVALTRARDRLSIYVPLRMHVQAGTHHDRHVYAQTSRFLTTEALAMLDTEDDVIGQPPKRAPSELPKIALPTLDILFA